MEKRLVMCRWFENKIEEDLDFLDDVISQDYNYYYYYYYYTLSDFLTPALAQSLTLEYEWL